MGNHLLHLDAVFCAIPDQVPLRGSSTRNMRCLSPRHAWTFTRSPYQRRVGASDWSSGPVCSVGADASSRHSVPEAQPTSRNAKALAARVSSAGPTVAPRGTKRDELGLRDYLSGTSTETRLYVPTGAGEDLRLSDQRMTSRQTPLVYAREGCENETFGLCRDEACCGSARLHVECIASSVATCFVSTALRRQPGSRARCVRGPAGSTPAVSAKTEKYEARSVRKHWRASNQSATGMPHG
jgi:hypothetical protein